MYTEYDDQNTFELSDAQNTQAGTWKRHGKRLILSAAVLSGSLGLMTAGQASAQECTDPDGDGWGWDGFASCIADDDDTDTETVTTEEETPDVETTQIHPPVNVSQDIVDFPGSNEDNDDSPDGTEEETPDVETTITVSASQDTDELPGYNGGGNDPTGPAAVIEPVAETTAAECIDPDGDGWGWDGFASCIADDDDTDKEVTTEVTTKTTEEVTTKEVTTEEETAEEETAEEETAEEETTEEVTIEDLVPVIGDYASSGGPSVGLIVTPQIDEPQTGKSFTITIEPPAITIQPPEISDADRAEALANAEADREAQIEADRVAREEMDARIEAHRKWWADFAAAGLTYLTPVVDDKPVCEDSDESEESDKPNCVVEDGVTQDSFEALAQMFGS